MDLYSIFRIGAIWTAFCGILSLIMGSLYILDILILELPKSQQINCGIALLINGVLYMTLFGFCLFNILKRKQNIWISSQFSSVEMRPLLTAS